MTGSHVQETTNNAYHSLIIAGFGGQGVLLTGNLFAYAAMHEGQAVSFLPYPNLVRSKEGLSDYPN